MAIVAIIMMLLALITLLVGGVVTLLASRRAPDGFEDQQGFHLGRTPPGFPPK